MDKLSNAAFGIALLAFIIGMAGVLARWPAAAAHGLTLCVFFGILGAALSWERRP